MNKKLFLKKWISVNTLGFFIGYLIYTPVGHGITGNHTRDMNTNQFIAHSVALGIVGLILFLFQKSVLKNYFTISTRKIFLLIIAFISLFWFGYYQTIIPGGLDWDILFGFLVLGSGLWFNKISFSNNKWIWLIAVLSFPIASFIGEVILFLIFNTFNLDMNMQNAMNDMIFWLTVGLTTGILGGWISGLMLYKLLPGVEN
ncbi:hypothetical protein [Flagellimonas algicola]|uniref:DUF2306 domain-containing protein n=1 Tax=Flagellimonas algicola TaxID=2583815 RepID=A0ABY2WI16_9FLAO|nr:hypothetical protein [Allomuricauda algicola]TMU54476.1 hypothetical protein FGG15_09645 [Allomuricauda algicola]